MLAGTGQGCGTRKDAGSYGATLEGVDAVKQSDIKNAIARCALSGITGSLEKVLLSATLVDCDICDDDPRSVQVVLTIDGNWSHMYEFMVRELQA